MSELKLPRLLAAAKEFNIGRDTLVEFLEGKGFNKDDLNGNVKLDEPMYRALQHQFSDDKVAKNKADRIEIPKGVQGEKRKKETAAAPAEAAVTPVSEPQPTPIVPEVKEEPKVVVPETKSEPIVEKAPTPVVEPEPKVQAQEQAKVPVEVETKEKVAELPKQEETPAPIVETPKTVQQPIAEEKKEEPVSTVQSKVEDKPVINKEEEPKTEAVQASTEETPPSVVKIEVDKIEGPKILDKIDLSAIDSSTRPKKGNQKPFEPKQGGNQPKQQDRNVPKPVNNPERPKIQPAPKAPMQPYTFTESKKTIVLNENDQSHTEHQDAVITKIEAEKLEGPKILGKIELPVDNDTRPKVNRDEKRKRKRIPIDKKGNEVNQPTNRNQQQGGNQQGGNRPPFNRQGGQQGQGNNNSNNRTGGGQQQGNRPPFNRQGQGGNNNGGNRNNNFRDNRGGGFNRNNTPEDKEIDQKKIQEKIRETQAKLAGGNNNKAGKHNKAKHRRERRQEMEAELNEQNESRVLNVTEFITVSELANLMDVSFADIISKCMSLGIMVSINQRLDAEVIELVAGEFNYTVSFIDLDEHEVETEEEVEDNEDDLVPRSPIVTIMGHVDHGKTSLLDYIRNANVVAGEAGGITQHIGAYVVSLENGRKITVLDTPGHEAFTAMRARGAKVTDIAVIVIAADDAVMPQTKEAISHAQAAGVPMIFAINKIDKEGANPTKIYEQLSNMNILVEEWGGTFQNQEISAKQGLNVDLLLEKILLEADILNLRANPKREASGSIVEASLDKGRGYVATILVQNGTLHQGDIIVSGQHYGRAKAMFNERNQRIDTAGPSTPVQILGLNGAPQAGEKFKVYADESEAKEVATTRARILREQGLRTRKHITLDEIGRRLALGSFKELNIIIKGDVDGSVEALSDSLQKLSTEEIVVNVIFKAVGQISESDVLLATASDAIIVGFNVRASSQAAKLADNEGVQIRSYSIIYNAIEEIKSAMEGMLDPKVQEVEVATIEIREVYKFDKATVAGCYVLEGKVKRDNKIKIFRDGILVYPRTEGAYGEFGSLKRFKDDVKEVAQGYECGLTIKNFADIQVGDNIVAYMEEEVKRTL
ncbi:MAG: translation initiation factor IF-2 [Pseudopedobacter saltans]|uniref:Translation initiation factor IF-2 n=1 Tax=Pseudopedobacter saltans TaxID=151895 RepID=A0A2W5FAC4_9SPHI|nr:MAG: translation initiation factor IF-2 [Pseudopedobacter saltans]